MPNTAVANPSGNGGVNRWPFSKCCSGTRIGSLRPGSALSGVGSSDERFQANMEGMIGSPLRVRVRVPYYGIRWKRFRCGRPADRVRAGARRTIAERRLVDDAQIADLLRRRRLDLEGELRLLTERPVDAMPAVSFGKRIGDGTTEAVERINQTAAARSISASAKEVERA